MDKTINTEILTLKDTDMEENITTGKDNSQVVGLKTEEYTNEEHDVSNNIKNLDQHQLPKQLNNIDVENIAATEEETTRTQQENDVTDSNDNPSNLIDRPDESIDSVSNLIDNQPHGEIAEAVVDEDMDTDTYQ